MNRTATIRGGAEMSKSGLSQLERGFSNPQQREMQSGIRKICALDW
jgi:hypothetical protein